MNGLEEVKGEDGGRVKYVAARIIVSKDEAIDWLSALPGGKAAMLKEWGIAKMNGMWSIQSTMNGLILVVDNPTPPEPVTEVNVVWDEVAAQHEKWEQDWRKEESELESAPPRKSVSRR